MTHSSSGQITRLLLLFFEPRKKQDEDGAVASSSRTALKRVFPPVHLGLVSQSVSH